MTKTISKLSAVALAVLLAAATFSLYTYEAAAFMGMDWGGDDDRTTINTDNEASVSNDVSVTANTGDNYADAGDGGSGSAGGDASRGTGGRGGNGGAGGDGGTIETGAATAIGTVHNDVNSNRVIAEGCGCDDDDEQVTLSRFFHFGDDGKVVRIDADNGAEVHNELHVDANTGRNGVENGDGGRGGAGGDAQSSRSWWWWFQFMNQDNIGGDGGNGGAGGDGGTIRTEMAYADGLVTNILNRNVVRVENGDNSD